MCAKYAWSDESFSLIDWAGYREDSRNIPVLAIYQGMGDENTTKQKTAEQ